jgi:hypothetical protein
MFCHRINSIKLFIVTWDILYKIGFLSSFVKRVFEVKVRGSACKVDCMRFTVFFIFYLDFNSLLKRTPCRLFKNICWVQCC